MSTSRRTPLFDDHRAAGARFVEFAGWEMPVQYDGILAEHTAVRNSAGLFDVSHMARIEVRGAAALECLQWVMANDAALLTDGDAQYSLLMLEDGGIADDVIVYRHSDRRFLVCANAANRCADVAYLRQHARGAEIADCSDDTALLALQGPRATVLLGRLCDDDLSGVRSFRFAESRVAGVPVMCARTGYTGEDGWELYCAAGDASALWQAILGGGRDLAVVPAGLGSRDTLRLEAALPLYGHELDRDTHPYEARLGWVVRAGERDFIARKSLQALCAGARRRTLAGVSIAPGKGIPRAGYRLIAGGRRIGHVTSGSRSPTLGMGIGLGYVEPDLSTIGTAVGVEIRGRVVDARVTALPFYRRAEG